ncbi:ADP-ribosylglycohydrolase family protein [Calorimonas adulescens]|jgi:ADP-ribosylglycohydrolase./Uracil DNA glycosylase superfamily.|uniref:Uracil-DNA glycosylase-like domain-containing protein n=1 Tax=Calorimonas adulescens TaxID=2606906 RepID=A0A5D8QD00_9THEO|nr:ADP-ribosylglycohydrolase family protein [Calorimonas adulescens]TZE81413.1 hypothetical protein FWJ32_09550 [Calorimonas adulescens]
MIDRYEGCLVGLAIGDALGMPVELMGVDEIERTYGHIEDMVNAKAGLNSGLLRGQYTDDTQMTIALAEAIIEAGYVEQYTVSGRFVKLDGKLIGPGLGCMTGIKNMERGVPWDRAGSDSAGNGAAMRTAPVALFYHGDPDRIIRATRVHSIMTHRDERAVEAAVITSLTIDYLLDGRDPDELIGYVLKFARNEEIIEEIKKVDSIIKGGIDEGKAIKQFNISGYSVGTLGASLYIFLRYRKSFKDAVLMAVNMGGDSDTIASIVGAFSGAYNGIYAIPDKWISSLKDSGYIRSLADTLYDLSLNPYKPVPDVLDYNLKVIFVGYNPGLESAKKGHFYASNTNRFWRVLYESGILPEPLTYEDDWRMAEYGYGLTDIVKYCTREAAEITDDMYERGKKRLLRILNQYRPKVACYNGKGIYKKLMGLTEVDYGLQKTSAVPGIIDYVVPSTSGRTGVKWEDRLGYFKELNKIIKLLN